MKHLSDVFEDSVDFSLFHYTGIGALTGIVSTKTLWASSISSLNDSMEILQARDMLLHAMRPRMVFGLKNEEYDFLTRFQERLKHADLQANYIFVFSLSEERSILSQWRSYTPHGKGVSIEFSPETINRIINGSNFQIAQCAYNEEEQFDLAQTLVSYLTVKFRSRLALEGSGAVSHHDLCDSVLNEYWPEILQTMALFKHAAFSEEREWRLISKNFESDPNAKISFREGGSILVPYVEIPLGDELPMFEDIRIGPSPHSKAALSTLAMFNDRTEVSNRVSICGIPYREW